VIKNTGDGNSLGMKLIIMHMREQWTLSLFLFLCWAWEQNYHNVRINISAKFGSASNQNLYLYYVLQFALHRDKEVEE